MSNRPCQSKLLCALLLAALWVGCSAPSHKVLRQEDTLARQWQTNVAYQANLPERSLDWPAALAQLRAENLKLRQTRTELTNAQESVRQVFRDLVPTLNMHANISKRLVDIPTITADDINFSADSLFNLPGLVSFNARLYTARLSLLRAAAAYALTEREQIIELYKVFWAFQEHGEQIRHLQNEQQTARAFEAVDPFTSQVLLTSAEVRALGAEQESANLQQRTSDVLGSRQFKWVLLPHALPELPYDINPLPLDDTNRVARLQIRLAAIEYEGVRAQLAGMKLRYWPDLTIFVSGPPIYQRSFGRETFWDAEELRASADVFWWIDTRGYISRQIRMTERQRGLQEARLRQDSMALIRRLQVTQDLFRATAEQARDLENQLLIMEAVPPAQNYAALEKYAVEYQNTADQLRRVRRELAELKTLFWFVDEAAWQDLSPLPTLVKR